MATEQQNKIRVTEYLDLDVEWEKWSCNRCGHEIGPARQSYKRGKQRWPYWQVSFTSKGKSKTNYVRDEYVQTIKTEIAEYKKFRELMEKWIDLSITLSVESMKNHNSKIKSKNSTTRSRG